MKVKKRVISLLLVAIMMFNSIPAAHADTAELTINGSLADAITNMEYGWDGRTYRFSEDVLEGVRDGDEVYLMADVVTSDPLTAGSTVSLELINLRLEGANAADYLLPDLTGILPIEKQINIFAKTIVIRPAQTYIYYGQDAPVDGILTKLADYSGQLVGDDEVYISCDFEIQFNGSSEVGTYDINLKGTPTMEGEDASNYRVEVADDLKFDVRTYAPTAEAVPEEDFDGNYDGQQTAILYAPEGFLISETGGKKSSEWDDSITVTLEETNDGSITYYLRNDSKDADEYRAICKKVHNYSSIPLPSISGIEIKLVDPGAKILFREDGVFANGNVQVTVYAVGGKIAEDTTIFLGKNGKYDSVLVAAADAEEQSGKYLYQASFAIESTDGKCLQYYLDAYAQNSAGTGKQYSASNSNDDFVDTDTSITAPLVLDRAPANVTIHSIEGNYENRGILAEFSIEDFGSGVEKVEYKWDQAEYAVLNSYDSSKTQFSLLLPWYAAQYVPGGKHTFALRVTDKLGNITERSMTDGKGSDFIPPAIESVEVKTTNGDALTHGPNGYFSKEAVQIAIKAHDNEAETNAMSSGVKSVSVNDFEATWNKDANAYVLTVAPDSKLTDIRITVTDKVGLETTKSLKEFIPGLEASNIYVDNKAPVISFDNFKELGHVYEDEEDKIWFGKDVLNKMLKISCRDNPNENNSGLASITIQDGDRILYDRTFDSVDVASDVFAYYVSSFSDGDHTITVTVVDNCGNNTVQSISFTKQTSSVIAAEISITKPEAKEIDGEYWFGGEDNITFRVGTTDNVTKLWKIELNINGQKREYSYKKIIADDDGYGVLIDTSDFKLSDKHEYVISAKVWNRAQNDYDLPSVTVHVDTNAPEIQKITVQKNAEITENQVLRILPFGIYSNDKLTFRVYASDADHDSGLYCGTVQFSAEGSPIHMNWDEQNGCYWFELSASADPISESTLAFAVYDRFGRICEVGPAIQNANNEKDQTKSTAVMIENLKPYMSISLPDGDGFKRTDGQKWYNVNKELELNVQDKESGIHSISFTVNGKTIKNDKNGKALIDGPSSQRNDVITYLFDTDTLAALAGKSETGEYRIRIVVTDNAGNHETFDGSYYIDKELPKIDSIDFIPATVDGITDTAKFVDGTEYGFFFNESFAVVVNVSDATPSSGLYAINYRLVSANAELTGEKTIEDGKAIINPPAGFKGQIFVEALDYTNNSSGELTTMAYVADSSAPEITITKFVDDPEDMEEINNPLYHDAEGNPLYTRTIKLKVVITDRTAGLEQIIYNKTAERFPLDEQTISIENRVYKPGELLDDGWEVVSVDHNLVTVVQKTFVFEADDNNIAMHFSAMDRSHNTTDSVDSEVFTIDTTNPTIDVVFRDDNDNDLYYNQNRIADIKIIERNFDEKLINILIKNTFGAVPGYTFTSISRTEHTVTIDFGEGDYTFDVTGRDLGGHNAAVTFTGGNEKLFYVDKTAPTIVENFSDFANEKENSHNADKTAMITIKEHNFDPRLTNLVITRKAAGEEHSQDGMVDVTREILDGINWTSHGDTHSIEFTLHEDAIYYIHIAPVDLASNHGDTRSTVIFEVDKTAPVVSAKNGLKTDKDDTQFLDIYGYERKDSAVPTVEFQDLNISYIEYTLMTYTPEYLEDGLIKIKPIVSQGVVEGNLFTLEDFSADGIYTVELIAVDIAGNKSAPNTNTYARMVYQDVLAFILDSNSKEGTGLYSLEHENGEAISKKPYDFKDLRILVMAPADTDIAIVLRDTNGNDIPTESYVTNDNGVYGINVSTFVIPESFFRENFQEDVDMEMNLTVRNRDYRIDLASIHIDSIAPTCDLPKELTSWRWFAGEDDRVFTITNISEQLEAADCKVYDNGELIPFDYSAEEDTITFKLSKGWHNIGIVLCDTAGNSNNIPEIVNIHIGNFWIITAGSAFATVAAAVVIVLAYKRKREKKEMTEDT